MGWKPPPKKTEAQLREEELQNMSEKIDPLKESETMKFLIGKCVGSADATHHVVSVFRELRLMLERLGTLKAAVAIIEQETDETEGRDVVEELLAKQTAEYAQARRSLAAYMIAGRSNPALFNCNAGPTNRDVPMTVAGFGWFEDLLRTYRIRKPSGAAVTIKQITDALSEEPEFLAEVLDHFGLETRRRKAPGSSSSSKPVYITPVGEATKVLTAYLKSIGAEELVNASILVR